MKYMAEFIEHFNKRNYFSIRDARIFLKQKKISTGYLKLLIHTLLKKNKLKRLAKGIYTFKDELMVAGFAFSPFYYGLHEALSIHRLWGQATNPVIITTKKVRAGTRTVMDSNITIKRISPKMFFGYKIIEHYGLQIPVSDLEKTLIDFAYFRQKIPEEALKTLLASIQKKRLGEYLRKSPKQTRKAITKLLEKPKKRKQEKSRKLRARWACLKAKQN